VRRESRAETSPTTASNRTLAGARLAAISVASGAVATIASILGVAYVASIGSATVRSEHDALLASHTSVPQQSGRDLRRLDSAPEGSGRPVREQHIGDIIIIDVGAQVVSLDDELDRQRAIAARTHRRLVLWLVTEDCKPCNAVEAALGSAEVQLALSRTRLVRLDAVEFATELSRLGVPMDATPAFVLPGPDGYAIDYIHGGEWDEDIPDNIAPVLKSFVEGTYTRRRMPWRGGAHDDETPI
jgi:hypothetical protein